MAKKATTNYKDWKRALADYQKATGKAFVEDSLNKRAGRLGFGAKKFTPRAKKGTFPLNATANPDKGGKTYKQKIFFVLAGGQRRDGSGWTKGGGVKRGSGGARPLTAEANRIYSGRRRAVGAIGFGFIRAGRDFGKRGGGTAFNVAAGSTVSDSKGTRATARSKRATLLNAVDGSEELGPAAMDKAFRADAADMRVYTDRKLAEAAKKHSGRRK